MLNHPCGRSCAASAFSKGASEPLSVLPASSDDIRKFPAEASWTLHGSHPSGELTWESIQSTQSARGLGVRSPAVEENLSVHTAFLGPVNLRLPMYVPSKVAAMSLQVSGLRQAPRSIRVHLLDAQRYGIQADRAYDQDQMAQAAPFALDLDLNRRAYIDSAVLRAALAQKDGDEDKKTSWLQKAGLQEVPPSLRNQHRSQILRWLQQVLAILAPVDILFGLREFLFFLNEKLQVSGLGKETLVAVCNVPQLDNAFFAGGYMVFGNGKQQFYPLASLDVIGHEMGHGVIEMLSPLKYQGHSGALNESFADVIGTCFEFFVQNKFNRNASKEDDLTNMGPADYDIGEDLDLGGKYLRNMQEPEAAPFPQPSSVHGRFYVDPSSDFDYGGVHVNSGIPNVLFYRLAQKVGRVRAMRVFFDVLRSGTMPHECSFETFGLLLLNSAQKFRCRNACRHLAVETKMVSKEKAFLQRPPLPTKPPPSLFPSLHQFRSAGDRRRDIGKVKEEAASKRAATAEEDIIWVPSSLQNV